MTKLFKEQDGEGADYEMVSAVQSEVTKAFMEEYKALCEKHNMTLAPCYEMGLVDTHDNMMVTIYDDWMKEFINDNTIACTDEIKINYS